MAAYCVTPRCGIHCLCPGSLVAADENGLIRGSRFRITVTGAPKTPYCAWLARTFTLSGEPGNQRPILLTNQTNIVKDPLTTGPYVIGSYQIHNGGGSTIREDVAPSTALMSSTPFYALFTTNEDGRAIAAFQTSSATAPRAYPRSKSGIHRPLHMTQSLFRGGIPRSNAVRS